MKREVVVGGDDVRKEVDDGAQLSIRARDPPRARATDGDARHPDEDGERARRSASSEAWSLTSGSPIREDARRPDADQLDILRASIVTMRVPVQVQTIRWGN